MSKPETTSRNTLHATLTDISPAGWECRRNGACGYLITTPKEMRVADRLRVKRLFHPETELDFVEGEFNDD